MKITLVELNRANSDNSSRIWLIYADGKLIGRSKRSWHEGPNAKELAEFLGFACEEKRISLINPVEREVLTDLLEDYYQMRKQQCEKNVKHALADLDALEKEFGN